VSSAFVELDSDDDECELLSVSNVLELLTELEEWLLTLESLLDDSLLSEDELLLLELELFEELDSEENEDELDEDKDDEVTPLILLEPELLLDEFTLLREELVHDENSSDEDDEDEDGKDEKMNATIARRHSHLAWRWNWFRDRRHGYQMEIWEFCRGFP